MAKEKELKRTVSLAFQPYMRESEDNKSRTIEGYALLFGERSVMLADWVNTYYEVLEQGCITREVLDNSDIKMTMFHNREKILARSNHGQGSLSYTIDDKGVKFSFDAPNTALGKEAIELVSRGDLAGCSFCYSTNEASSSGNVTYERSGEVDAWEDDVLIRHVHKIDHVYDFTLAADPAYEQTSVTLREVQTALGCDDTTGEHERESDEAQKAEEAKAKAREESMRKCRADLDEIERVLQGK